MNLTALTKTALIMKFTAVLLLAACLQVSARSNAQKVTLDIRNAPLEQVFKAIRKQTGYLFVYDLQLLQSAKKVDLHLKEVEIGQALDLCFKDQPFTYTILNKTVVIKSRPSTYATPESPLADIHGKITDPEGNPLQGVSVLDK